MNIFQKSWSAFFACLLFSSILHNLFAATKLEPAGDQLSFTISTQTAKVGEETCVEVRACKFDLTGFQFTISWDADIIAFSKVTESKLPFFLQSIYKQFPGMFRIAWLNENISTTVTLPDSSLVFKLCFIPKQPGKTALYFDTSETAPVQPEFVALNGETLDADLASGEITVLGCSTSASDILKNICEGDTYEGYSQSGQYTDIFTKEDGCDSIRILNLNVLSIIQTSISKTICEGENYEGRIAAGTYIDTYTSSSGCDSTRTLSLNILASLQTVLEMSICEGENYGGRIQTGTYIDTYQALSNGCDSIRTLHLTVLPQKQHTVDLLVCAGNCATIGTQTYCDSGTYRFAFSSDSGCDSIVLYNVTVSTQIQASSFVQICQGDFWAEGETLLSEPGSYPFTYTSSAGCDSIYTINLSFFEGVLETTQNITICAGTSINGRTQSGTYMDIYQNINGCDSIRTTNLTVLPPLVYSLDIAICEGQVYEGYTISGQYEEVFTTPNGCDSIRTLNLRVNKPILTTVERNICDGESFEGYSISGQYEDVFTARNGCDSIRTLNLKVSSTIQTTITNSICEGSNVAGYDKSGIYIDTFSSISGCDSIRTLELTVAPNIETIIQATICEGEKVEGFTKTGNYLNLFKSASGCDSMRILELEVYPISNTIASAVICEGENFEGLTKSGVYTFNLINQNGCDSIFSLDLQVLAANDSNCVRTPTIELNPLASLTYYPNPIRTTLYLEWNAAEQATFSILDLSGRTLIANSPLSASTVIDLHSFISGVYYLKIDTLAGIYYAKLVKL